jgi:G3E family GTPase
MVSLEPGFLNPAHGDAGHVHDDSCGHGNEPGPGHEQSHGQSHEQSHGAAGHEQPGEPAAANPIHDAGIHSVSLTNTRPMEAALVQRWLGDLVAKHGGDILRAKGIIDVAGEARRMVFQSVHSVLEGDWQRPWHADEPRHSRLVFIGRQLNAAALAAAFDACAAAPCQKHGVLQKPSRR